MDIKIDTTPGSVSLGIPTSQGDALIDLPASAAARLGLVLLHHAGEAAAKADRPTNLAPGEGRATPTPIQISEAGLAPDGSVVLKCEAAGGLSFHLSVASEAVQSLAALLEAALPEQAPPTRQ